MTKSSPIARNAICRFQSPHARIFFVAAVSLAAEASLVSCGKSTPQSQSRVSKIIDSDDRVSPGFEGENLPARYRALLPAFGAMREVDLSAANGGSSPLCTFTHIGKGLAVTAGHCLGAESERIEDKPCKNLLIDWNYTQGGTVLRSRCTRIVAAITDDELGVDFGLVSVDVFPEVSIPLSQRGAELGSKITIFGFPMGRTLTWSGTCLVLSALGFFNENYLGHTCDTEGGNSGSVFINDADLSIVGIHDGGTPELNYGTSLANVRKIYSNLP